MHVPDHMLNDPTSAATGAVACAAIAYAAYRSREDLTRQRIALTAATGAVVFALQMVNYPVAAGTSGHLMGGVLAAALVGPWLGMLAVTLVLLVQATLFADGGLTALGTNTLLMAVTGVAVGWAVTQAVQHLRGAGSRDGAATSGASAARSASLSTPRSAPLAAGLGALVSVPASAAVFVALFAAGGAVSVPLGELTASMLSVHALIGLGEALITAGVIAVVLAVAPGAAHIDPRPAQSWVQAPARRAVLALSAIAAVTAVGLSSFAASSPDGLEATAEQLGFLDVASQHALAGLPFADYGAASGSPVGLAGLLGIVVVAGLAAAMLGAARSDRSGSYRTVKERS
ncbi:energy-coupling factor ABC transporter permease [Sanguibacter suarezii]|uniref:energy-coupling factor ABC transporter permease n=1 Tax=Sanguibacter suarezii TaxID=60921 RepID=UPI000832D97F|nr:energy-coupling factor ABC transporter permease [Sanguibacter suarezii]